MDDTLAKPLRPVSILISDDLPTLLRPINATSRKSSFGTCEIFSELHLNSAFVTCIINLLYETSLRRLLLSIAYKNRQKKPNNEIVGQYMIIWDFYSVLYGLKRADVYEMSPA